MQSAAMRGTSEENLAGRELFGWKKGELSVFDVGLCALQKSRPQWVDWVVKVRTIPCPACPRLLSRIPFCKCREGEVLQWRAPVH